MLSLGVDLQRQKVGDVTAVRRVGAQTAVQAAFQAAVRQLSRLVTAQAQAPPVAPPTPEVASVWCSHGMDGSLLSRLLGFWPFRIHLELRKEP